MILEKISGTQDLKKINNRRITNSGRWNKNGIIIKN